MIVNGTMRLDRTRLAKVLSMLQSSHPGEVVAAANRAVSMLREAGLEFDDIVGRPEPLDLDAIEERHRRAWHRPAPPQAELREYEQTIADLRSQLSEHEDWRNRAAARIADLEDERRQQNGRLRALAAEAEDARQTLAAAHEELLRVRMQLAELDSERRRLRDLVETAGSAAPAWRHNADKRAAVLMLLNDPETSGLSDREIARRAGVSPQTVGNVRRDHADTTGSDALARPTERTVTRNGKAYTMRVAHIGKKPQRKRRQSGSRRRKADADLLDGLEV